MSDQKEKNVFTEMKGDFAGNEVFQNEGKDYQNSDEFIKLVNARRSVRRYTDEQIPSEIVHKCLDLALLAPNSSNLQTWEFIRVVSPEVKKAVVKASFSQPAAATAPELIVCIARYSKWRERCKETLEQLNALPVKPPKTALIYYGKLIPALYTVGPLNILTPFKWIFNTIVGSFKVIPRSPISSFGLNTWAVKSCALACQNLMLAFRSYGYDTCPMEGYDSCKVKKALGLKGQAEIVMIISAGKRADGGVYGPRLRFDRNLFIKEV